MNYLIILLLLPLSVLATEPLREIELSQTETSTTVELTPEKTSEEPSDKDFVPKEEISEDYSIPLPSDI
jgi:hypothetical protein